MFRFTIRDVLWLTVVVALGVCWFSSNQRATRFQQGYDVLMQKKKEVEAMHNDAVRKLQESAANVSRAKAEREEGVRYWRDSLGRPQKTP
jgi:hypothetical protein